LQDIVAVLKVPVSKAQELQQDYLNAGKPDNWKFGDSYDYSKYDAELNALENSSIETKVEEKKSTYDSDLDDLLSSVSDATIEDTNIFKEEEKSIIVQPEVVEPTQSKDIVAVSEESMKAVIENIENGRGDELYDNDREWSNRELSAAEDGGNIYPESMEEADDWAKYGSPQEQSIERINNKYDIEYIDNIKKGNLTKQQAKKSLKEFGRLSPELEKQIDNIQVSQKADKIITRDDARDILGTMIDSNTITRECE